MLGALFNIISLQEKFANIDPADLNCYYPWIELVSKYKPMVYMILLDWAGGAVWDSVGKV